MCSQKKARLSVLIVTFHMSKSMAISRQWKGTKTVWPTRKSCQLNSILVKVRNFYPFSYQNAQNGIKVMFMVWNLVRNALLSKLPVSKPSDTKMMMAKSENLMLTTRLMIVRCSQFMKIPVFTTTMVTLNSTRTRSCAAQIELNVPGWVIFKFQMQVDIFD